MDSILQSILLALAFIGLILLILTRFVKSSFALTLISFVAYFYYIGLDDWFSLFLFVLGMTLIVVEAFVPDFGILGILGLGLFIAGLYLTTSDWWAILQDISIALILSVTTAYFLVKSGNVSNRWAQFVLSGSSSPPKSSKQESAKNDELHLGQRGQTVTPLRPSGYAVFEDELGHTKEVDVTSEIQMIEKNQAIEIVDIIGNKVIVRSV